MIQYLIRAEDKKTHILRVGDSTERIGLIYTDFRLHFGIRDISMEDIVDSETNKLIGNVQLHKKGNIISVNMKKKGNFELTKSGEYKENGVVIPCRKLTKAVLLKQEYQALEEMGVTHAYFLGDKSSLSKVFCFEKDRSLAGLVYTKDSDDISAFKGLTLVLAQMIEEQDYVFEFMK